MKMAAQSPKRKRKQKKAQLPLVFDQLSLDHRILTYECFLYIFELSRGSPFLPSSSREDKDKEIAWMKNLTAIALTKRRSQKTARKQKSFSYTQFLGVNLLASALFAISDIGPERQSLEH